MLSQRSEYGDRDSIFFFDCFLPALFRYFELLYHHGVSYGDGNDDNV